MTSSVGRQEMPLFHRLYGDGLDRLPAAIRAVHAVDGEASWHGTVTIERGSGSLAALVCRLLGFPPAGHRLPLSMTMCQRGDGEEWHRRFGKARLDSRLTAGDQPATIVERLGPAAAQSRLDCDGHGVTQTLVGLKLFGMPLPRLLWPRLDVRESAIDDATYGFSMRIAFPWRGLIIHYHGSIDVGRDGRKASV